MSNKEKILLCYCLGADTTLYHTIDSLVGSNYSFLKENGGILRAYERKYLITSEYLPFDGDVLLEKLYKNVSDSYPGYPPEVIEEDKHSNELDKLVYDWCTKNVHIDIFEAGNLIGYIKLTRQDVEAWSDDWEFPSESLDSKKFKIHKAYPSN